MSGKYPTPEVTKQLLNKVEAARGTVHEIENDLAEEAGKDEQLSLL